MGRKSCKKQQKRQQPQPQQSKRWWSRVPTQFGPLNWVAEHEQRRAEGATMYDACGEFGHDRDDCPYGDPQYEEAWNQGLVGEAAEWFWAVDHTQVSSTPRSEEPECPPPKPAPAEEECLLITPPSPEEISWEAILHTVKASCWCPICGERGHSPLNCPLLPEGRLLHPFPTAEEGCLLVPSLPAEGACLLVPPLQPEREEPLPPLQPEGEETLPPLQPEGEEPLLPLPTRGDEQELPLPPPPPLGEVELLLLPSWPGAPLPPSPSPGDASSPSPGDASSPSPWDASSPSPGDACLAPHKDACLAPPKDACLAPLSDATPAPFRDATPAALRDVTFGSPGVACCSASPGAACCSV
ncbi:UNVERIFIED_CONTAM: hypothetical protein FKN15_062778 [Acipenser sinensis]